MEYNKNLEVLKEAVPQFYQKLIDADTDSIGGGIEKIETIPARDGNPISIITVCGKEYRLNSPFRPAQEAKKWAEQFSFKNLNNNVILYGFGNGYFVNAILDKMPEKDYLLIYEPCLEMFLHALHNYNLESVFRDPRVIISVAGINEYEFHMTLNNIFEVTNLVNSNITIHPAYDKLFQEQFIEFKKDIITSAQSARIYYNTLLRLAEASVNNNFTNIPKIRGSISIKQLEKIWNPEIPAIVVAAGPSVEQSIEALKNVKGRAVIIAVDRILQYLLDNGVKPDFVVTLDPRKNSNNFSREGNVEVPMFCTMQSNPLIMDKQAGRKIICSAGNYMNEHYKKVEGTISEVPVSGSVATFAVSIANYLGVKKILLVGQDLAFHGESTHAGGVVSNPFTSASEWVEGIHGEKVKARYDWVEFRNWFQDFAKTNPDVTLIDTKKEGALIKGTRLMSLEEAIQDCQEGKVQELIAKMNELPSTFSEEYFNAIREQIVDEREVLSKMKQKAKEGAMLCADLITLVKQGKSGSRTIDGKVEKIKKITAFLGEQKIYANLDEVVVAYMKNSYVKVFTEKEDEEENLLNVYDSSRSYFECVEKAVKAVDPAMEACVKELEG